MSARAKVVTGDRALTIRIPMALRKRGGRKQVLTPDGAAWAPPRARIDNATVKALARGFRWQRLLETSVHSTIEELATAEKINSSYVSRLLRLTLLAPSIIEAILDGSQQQTIQLSGLLKPFPGEWKLQLISYRPSDKARTKL